MVKALARSEMVKEDGYTDRASAHLAHVFKNPIVISRHERSCRGSKAGRGKVVCEIWLWGVGCCLEMCPYVPRLKSSVADVGHPFPSRAAPRCSRCTFLAVAALPRAKLLPPILS